MMERQMMNNSMMNNSMMNSHMNPMMSMSGGGLPAMNSMMMNPRMGGSALWLEEAAAPRTGEKEGSSNTDLHTDFNSSLQVRIEDFPCGHGRPFADSKP